MKNLLRKILHWLFEDRLHVYAVSKFVSDYELVNKPYTESHIKRQLANTLAEKLIDEGVVDIEEHRSDGYVGREFRMKIYVLK